MELSNQYAEMLGEHILNVKLSGILNRYQRQTVATIEESRKLHEEGGKLSQQTSDFK